MDKFVTVSFNPHPGLAWMRELTGSFCYYWFLTTLQLFKYMLSRLMHLYSLLSSANEMIPLHTCTVKRFLYEFYKRIEISVYPTLQVAGGRSTLNDDQE